MGIEYLQRACPIYSTVFRMDKIVFDQDPGTP